MIWEPYGGAPRNSRMLGLLFFHPHSIYCSLRGHPLVALGAPPLKCGIKICQPNTTIKETEVSSVRTTGFRRSAQLAKINKFDLQQHNRDQAQPRAGDRGAWLDIGRGWEDGREGGMGRKFGASWVWAGGCVTCWVCKRMWNGLCRVKFVFGSALRVRYLDGHGEEVTQLVCYWVWRYGKRWVGEGRENRWT